MINNQIMYVVSIRNLIAVFNREVKGKMAGANSVDSEHFFHNARAVIRRSYGEQVSIK